jgi:tRNA U38,U39,U40 pseudouridine synthase TruA
MLWCDSLNAYRITVKGKGFLRYMIRRIVGACISIATHPYKDTQILRTALAEKNPHQHLYTAPASGLILRHIVYQT